MAESAVQICNNALIKLGSNTITSLSDDTKPARLCNKMYSIMRDDLIRSHPWNFTIERAALAQLASTPDFEFAFQYQLPSDCLRVLRLDDPDTEYRIEGRKLLTDSSTVSLIYIKQVTDEAQFDANFSNVLALKIASEIAYAITNSTSLSQALRQAYLKEFSRAKMNDAQEDSIYVLDTDTFTAGRFRGGGSSIVFEASTQ